MPEKVASISELVKMGYSRAALKAYVQDETFPGYKTPGGGKWYVYVDKLPGWIEHYNRVRRNESAAVTRSRRRKIYGKRGIA